MTGENTMSYKRGPTFDRLLSFLLHRDVATMFSTADYSFTHVISAADIWLEAHEIKEALSRGGYVFSNLDLEDVAVQAKTREIYDAADRLEIRLIEVTRMKPNFNGDVDVMLGFPTKGEMMAMRLSL
jgi:hypothetical protein